MPSRLKLYCLSTCLYVFLQVKYLPVFEADSVLRVEMFDYDAVNVTTFASLKESATMKVSSVVV